MLTLEQVLDRSEPIPETGCRVWMGRTNAQGYPTARDNKKHYAIHRLVFALTHGLNVRDIPATVCVRHTCDTPSCVNPDHLLAGSWADNIRDAISRSRHAVAFNASGKCKHGHDLSVAGIYDNGIRRSGYRLRGCRECKRQRARLWASANYSPEKRREAYARARRRNASVD